MTETSPRMGRFYATLVTRGRRTGRPHRVRLLAVRHMGRVYFTRHRPDSDWFRNALAHPAVEVVYEGGEMRGTASEVSDPGLADTISELKYPGERRAAESRVAIEVTPS